GAPPAYLAFYAMVPRAAGGRLYSDTLGRLTFILFLVYSLAGGMHHLLMDPEHGNGWKFIQVLLTAFVSVPTLLTIFTITASLENRGAIARRPWCFRLDRGAAMGPADRPRGRPFLRDARFWWVWRGRSH